KINLTFYTNIPTPYQLDFFEALSERFNLRVVYYALNESNRMWEIEQNILSYPVLVLKDSVLIKPLLKRIVSFHFSWEIFRAVWFDPSEVVIFGGSYNCPNTVLGLFLSKIRKKRIGFFSEKLYPSKSRRDHIIKKIMLYPLKRSCQFLICVGQASVESYTKFNFEQKKIVIPYNISTDRFKRENLIQEKYEDLLLKLKTGIDYLMLSSGALIKRKGMDTLIKVITELDTTYKIKLIILGDGEDKNKLEKLIGNSDRVELVGFKQKEEIPYYYAIADIFLFATKYDGWGLVINEALAASLPVISSAQCVAAKELVKEGKNGFLCDADDIHAFKTSLIKLINDPTSIQKIIENNEKLGESISSYSMSSKLHSFLSDFIRVKNV
ncbi:MAG: glycosyltransferase family 4 protein, partial [Bacteroidota bacterium]